MKHKYTKIVSMIIAVVLVLGVCTTAFAADGYVGGKFTLFGMPTPAANWTVLLTSTSAVTTAMSPGGSLYSSTIKATALRNASASKTCYVERVRVLPTYPGTSQGDLRINPNASTNFVGPGKANGFKQVCAVQTILSAMDYYNHAVDGVYGNNTLNAIKAFQSAHGMSNDGIVGAQTWRALCSSLGFQHGSTVF